MSGTFGLAGSNSNSGLEGKPICAVTSLFSWGILIPYTNLGASLGLGRVSQSQEDVARTLSPHWRTALEERAGCSKWMMPSVFLILMKCTGEKAGGVK